MAFSASRVLALLESLPRPLPSGTELFFRSVSYLYAKGSAASVLTGHYAGENGGRCNPPQSEPVCYLAGTQTGAAFEVEQEQLLLGLAGVTNPVPRLSLGVSVEGASWLDLTNPAVCTYLQLAGDTTDLFMPSAVWRSLNRQGLDAPMQQLGAAARALGYDGVRYPAILTQYIGSALPRLVNVALFMAEDSPAMPANSRLRVRLHDHGLLAP